MTAAVVVAGGAALATAPAASAMGFEVDTGCAFPFSESLTVQAGDEIIVYGLFSAASFCNSIAWSPQTLIQVSFRDPVVLYVPANAQPGDTWVINVSEDGLNNHIVTITVAPRAIPAPTSAEPTPAPPIPAWVQAYGRASADATCEEGWSPSWESWAEKVTGGWVCTRNVPSLG